MIAAICTAYGDPDLLRLAEIPTPVAKDDEIRVRVVTTTVTSGDSRIRALRLPRGFGSMGRPLFGMLRPRQPILGTEFAGIVDQVGSEVTNFQAGEAVFAYVSPMVGAHAEYRTLKATAAIARKPSQLTWNEAAGLSFGGSTALHFFRKAGLRPGETLLIHGGSGSVGSAAIQIAKARGVVVHATCSARNTELVRTLGSDVSIDYNTTNLDTLPYRYDAILDCVGNLPLSRAHWLMSPRGRLMAVQASLTEILRAPWQSQATGQRVIVGSSGESASDLAELARLAQRGQYRPLVDEIYPFAFIADAHRRVDSGHKRGNVVVQISEP